jgi:LysM repeat protein
MSERFSHFFKVKNSVIAILTLFVFCLQFTNAVNAAQRPPSYYQTDTNTAVREMRDSLDALRHEVNNHETEIRMAEERSNNQEATISSMRQQLLDSTQSNKELLKGNSTSIDGKIVNIETINKGIIGDIGQLKTHANDTSTVLAEYKKKISDLEKTVSQLSQNIEHLQAALRSLTEAVAGPSTVDSGKTYRVKSGDSLEKIARAHNTTIKAIKELNKLSHDRIVIGQTLQIP